MDKFYKVPREEIADKLLFIFSLKGVKGLEKKTIMKALNSYNSVTIDSIDCFLTTKSIDKKIPVYSLDKKDFKLLGVDWKIP